ncbi:biopolymer transport protein TolR [Sphingobium sp. B2D3A]|nr:biopolymer transport protein TolR [Sphingobium sp. B2D3A]MCW2351440.1 biopolymer transport protein TolR [Sphingobium sp. B12D2B]MCW2362901.1 biopolymer transport protein TolR [Sphingobium sp. B10D3B]MCW2370661.1 biopolymer transport protein TolR [Sphingobium sp. B11D3D]MCW2380755.1 biopolymer transport protein TolR [Sphingobium sp. B2D3B]MCW2386620.1 biopolymer transport protein TolR [Sphingobium sp. B2D3D]MCW2389105.1 biopolymer transport protein TolR [Sphingobium sp. B11D3B]MCW2392928.1
MNLPSNRRGGRRAPMADINVTPLVDVMLVLLIIFMVTAPLLVTGVPVRLPESRASALDQDKKPAIVSVDPEGAVFINDDPVSDDALPDRLNALRAGLGPDEQVFLRADAALDYGRVMRVMGELNRAGLDRVALVTTGIGMGGSDPSTVRSVTGE